MRLFFLDRKKALTGAISGAVCFACCLLICAGDRAMLGLGAIFSIGFAVLGPVRLRARNSASSHPARLYLVWSLLALLGIYIAAQSTLRLNFMVAIRYLPLNMICIALPVLAFFLITLRPRLSFLLASLPLMALATVNCLVFNFRGFEVDITDLASVGTALGVLGNYRLRIDPPLFLGLAFWALVLFSGLCLPPLRIGRRRAARTGILSLTLCLMGIGYLGCTRLPARSFAHEGSLYNGLFANFTSRSLMLMLPEEPEGYSMAAVASLERAYPEPPPEDAEDGAPTVIVILNESFADLGVLGSEPNTREDVIPFFHSIRENAIRGWALCPTYAGGTSYAEYTVLSGNMLEHDSIGKNVYSLCHTQPSATVLGTFKRLGYTCAATHPFNANSWSRSTTYPMFGFDEMQFLDDYPQQDFVRELVSDREMYGQIIDRCERAAAADEKLFLLGITMQNHGGYTYYWDFDTPMIEIRSTSGVYPEAEQYLGLLRESDDALRELISYFEGIDRDVVILFFGDHFPGLDTALYEELHGGPLDGLEARQLTYTVPFLIWANYDIEEREIPLTSLNYLSDYLFEAAGLELPAYNRFLRDMEQVIPALNPQGFYSARAGRFLPYSEASDEEARWLRNYDILQYNCLRDAEHRSEQFFPIPESALSK